MSSAIRRCGAPTSVATRCLYIDMDGYFASCEQALRPELAGKPIGIALTLETDRVKLIAVSYEAKRRGVTRGMRISDARKICPELVIIKSRPEYYIAIRNAIIAAVNEILPVRTADYIDEMTCDIPLEHWTPVRAAALARQVKQAIAKRVGKPLTCSIGIAPNRKFAKIAAEMKKPNGLVVFSPHEFVSRTSTLPVEALSDIGPAWTEKLNAMGIKTIGEMRGLSEKRLRMLFRGINGSRWYHWLRGGEVPEPRSLRHAMGRSRILPPQYCDDIRACEILVHLLHSLVRNLRVEEYWAAGLELSISYGKDRYFWRQIPFPETQDEVRIFTSFVELLKQRPKERGLTPTQVGVALTDLVPSASATASLLHSEGPLLDYTELVQRTFRACHLSDSRPRLSPEEAAPLRISFTRIPYVDLKI